MNFTSETREGFQLPIRVRFHDTTLREGERLPGAVFSREEKLQLARLLDEIGVDRIEAGDVAGSAEAVATIEAIAKLGLRAEIAAYSGPSLAEIDRVAGAGADTVVLAVPCGAPRLQYQFRWPEDLVLRRSIEAVQYAKIRNLKVVYFPYDATRAEPKFLETLVRQVAVEARPDSVALVDSCGCVLPQAMRNLVRRVKELTNLPVEVHAHDDFGLATANTLAAVESSAEVAHVSVDGLGEGCGNAPLHEVAICLRALYGLESSIRFDRLYELSRAVRRLSGVMLSPSRPLVGDASFRRETPLGTDLFKRHPTVLYAVNPSFVGRSPELVLGIRSNKLSIRSKCQELGIAPTDRQVESMLAEVRAMGKAKKGTVSNAEFVAIAARILASTEVQEAHDGREQCR